MIEREKKNNILVVVYEVQNKFTLGCLQTPEVIGKKATFTMIRR